MLSFAGTNHGNEAPVHSLEQVPLLHQWTLPQTHEVFGLRRVFEPRIEVFFGAQTRAFFVDDEWHIKEVRINPAMTSSQNLTMISNDDHHCLWVYHIKDVPDERCLVCHCTIVWVFLVPFGRHATAMTLNINIWEMTEEELIRLLMIWKCFLCDKHPNAICSICTVRTFCIGSCWNCTISKEPWELAVNQVIPPRRSCETSVEIMKFGNSENWIKPSLRNKKIAKNSSAHWTISSDQCDPIGHTHAWKTCLRMKDTRIFHEPSFWQKLFEWWILFQSYEQKQKQKYEWKKREIKLRNERKRKEENKLS